MSFVTMYDGDREVNVPSGQIERFKSLGLTMEKKVAATTVKKEEETVTKKTESTVKSGTK